MTPKDLSCDDAPGITRAEVERLCREWSPDMGGVPHIPEGYAVEWVESPDDSPCVEIPHRHADELGGTDDLPAEPTPSRVRLERTSGSLVWRRALEGRWTHFYAGRCDRCRVAYLAGVEPDWPQLRFVTGTVEGVFDPEAAPPDLADALVCSLRRPTS
jgi:hypothetical protein